MDMYTRRLGILLGLSATESVKAPSLAPPVPGARDLEAALLADLLARLSKLKKIAVIVFHTGGEPRTAKPSAPRGVSFARQDARDPGDRLEDAFRRLLDGAGQACVMGADCPDLPMAYLKRAYVKLKHRDVVVGPTLGGGVYLVGLKRVFPGLFGNLSPRNGELFREMLRRVESSGRSCAVLPPWYEVNAQSLSLFETMLLARRIEKKDRLHASERVLDTMRRRSP
jgi:glycosyltransferase A (GT-A) superfamily protein (DUF2064 family)